jgi:hypothetical protein
MRISCTPDEMLANSMSEGNMTGDAGPELPEPDSTRAGGGLPPGGFAPGTPQNSIRKDEIGNVSPSKGAGGWRNRFEELAKQFETLAPFVGFLGVASIVCYAIGRYSISTLLEKYGIEPEEVGLSQPTLIWPVAATVAFFVAILLIGAAVARFLVSTPGKKRWVLAPPIGALLVWNLFGKTAGTLEHSIAFCIFYGFMFGLFVGVYGRDSEIEKKKQRRNRYSWAIRLMPAYLFLVPLLISSIFPWASLPDTMWSQIDNEQEAKSPALLVNPITVQIVRVLPSSGTVSLPPDINGHCLYLFGTSQGITVLYDAIQRKTSRIASSNIITQHILVPPADEQNLRDDRASQGCVIDPLPPAF